MMNCLGAFGCAGFFLSELCDVDVVSDLGGLVVELGEPDGVSDGGGCGEGCGDLLFACGEVAGGSADLGFEENGVDGRGMAGAVIPLANSDRLIDAGLGFVEAALLEIEGGHFLGESGGAKMFGAVEGFDGGKGLAAEVRGAVNIAEVGEQSGLFGAEECKGGIFGGVLVKHDRDCLVERRAGIFVLLEAAVDRA